MLFILEIMAALPCIVLVNFYLSREIYCLYFQYINRRSHDVWFRFKPLTDSEFKRKICILLLICTVLSLLHLYSGSFVVFSIFLLASVAYHFITKLSIAEKHDITEKNNLLLGYGAALWYYRNYLNKFLKDNLHSRIREFKLNQRVAMPERLYILCPLSCTVDKYIDDTPYIERCRELPAYIEDHAGIIGREFNITVYLIKHPDQNFRCAIECAQPLKSLQRFKEMGRINGDDLRDLHSEFCRHLTRLLREGDGTQKLCELVVYDDESDSVHEVLYRLESIQRFLHPKLVQNGL